ncbi:MAG: aminotransferase class I/II-fold pyridoxal phosphate-dependent enzyme [Parabacteroides distasonis]|nr:aminotransferase class I/II-fold pyridoxal phosphate-dependent enzyme [Parabacteroides distasonis]
MQAIILAAGMGKRLKELTQDNTKCMVKVHNQTLIERTLQQLSALSLTRIILVIGYKGEKVKALVGNKIGNTPILYIENPVYDKTNNIYSLYLAKNYLTEEDTILLESDLIFEDSILHKLITNPYPNLAVVAKYQSWMDGTVVTLDEDCNILNFISKNAFVFSQKDFYYKTVNIYKFSKDFSKNKYIPFLEAYCKALGNNEYYEQVLKVISLLDKSDLKALKIDTDKWYEIDDQQDLSNAESLFSEGSEALALFGKRFGGYWRFPMLLDFCYLVNPYFPNKRMKDEMRSNFDTLLTEYPSGMGINAQLAARYVGINTDQIIIGNGAAELINCYLSTQPTLHTGVILPTFEEYPNRIEKRYITYFQPKNKNFSYTCSDIISYFSDKEIEQLLIINPDNPSGNLLSKKELLTLINWTKQRHIRLIIDESFLDFAKIGRSMSLFDKQLLNENPHLIVIKSISKSYGVPGLRIGFLASGDKTLIQKLKKNISIWNINSFAEFYLQIFVKYQEDYNKACVKFINERERFFIRLKEVPFLRVIPSAANYFLCEVISEYSSEELCHKLLSINNILIKNCSTKAGFDGQSYIRIAIRNQKENDLLIEALLQLK